MESMIYDTQWYPLTVPSSWKGHRNWEDHPTLSGYTGFAWYRCFIRVPAEWRDHPCRLYLGYISECDETFVNRVRVGATGSFPPHWESGIPALRDYTVPPESLRFGTENLIAVRVYCSGREDSGGGLIGVQYGMSDFLYREYRFQPDPSASSCFLRPGPLARRAGPGAHPVVCPRRAIPGRAVAGAAWRRPELGTVARGVAVCARPGGRRVPPFPAPTRGRGHRDH